MDPTSPELVSALARLDAAINWERADRGAMRVDLSPMEDLVARLGDPHEAFETIHVGGTKGKGSVAALIGAALMQSGRRCGRYSSPHVEDVRERVEVQGAWVDDSILAAGIDAAMKAQIDARKARTPAAAATWFDLMTAAAFWAFRDAQVEVAIVEVGLGGRLDSTNVITPVLCVLTNVDLEHTDVLGSTRQAIAREKAGILKPGVPLVSGVGAGSEGSCGDDPGLVIDQRAEELGIPVALPAIAHGIIARNRGLASKALDVLGERGWCDTAGQPLGAHLLTIPGVVRAAELPGRLERRSQADTQIVLDGAHVPSSLEMVLAELHASGGLTGPMSAVISLAQDKDAQGFLKALVGHADRVICTCVDSGRHQPASELTSLARELGLAAHGVDSPQEALQQALKGCTPNGWVLVTGSLYLVGALRQDLDQPPTSPC